MAHSLRPLGGDPFALFRQYSPTPARRWAMFPRKVKRLQRWNGGTATVAENMPPGGLPGAFFGFRRPVCCDWHARCSMWGVSGTKGSDAANAGGIRADGSVLGE